jgi:hypothetical protein
LSVSGFAMCGGGGGWGWWGGWRVEVEWISPVSHSRSVLFHRAKGASDLKASLEGAMRFRDGVESCRQRDATRFGPSGPGAARIRKRHA